LRRADRLFDIIQNLRGDRVVTAQALADKLEVSVRTIYRDIADLQASGVPIDGEAGAGYLLRPGFQLPPLMFTLAEIEALIVGARMVQSWAGRELSGSAADALKKIAAVVPPDRMRAGERVAIFAPGFPFPEAMRTRFDLLARAIDEKRKTHFVYRDGREAASERTVRPLALHFWGNTWTLAAWCELRADFRNFRIDRAEEIVIGDERFRPEPGRKLEDFMARLTRAP
jgi:predicted DNA-binding transcriptional regulator YafY